MRKIVLITLGVMLAVPGAIYLFLIAGQVKGGADPSTKFPLMSDELKALCDEYGTFKVNRTVVADGFVAGPSEGCDSRCKVLLIGKGFSYVETDMSQSYWDMREPRNGKQHDQRMRAKHLVDRPGWYRFEVVDWGDSGTEFWADYLDQQWKDEHMPGQTPPTDQSQREINDDILAGKYSKEEVEELRRTSRYGQQIGRAIRTTPIDGPTARYRYKKISGREVHLHDETVYALIQGEAIVDTKTDEVLGYMSGVRAGFMTRKRNGDIRRSQATHYCGLPLMFIHHT